MVPFLCGASDHRYSETGYLTGSITDLPCSISWSVHLHFFFYCSLTDLYIIGNFHNILYYTFLETDLRSCLLIGFYLQDFSQWYSIYIQSMLWVTSLERSFIIKPFWGYPQWQLNRAGGLHGTGAQGVRSLCLIRAYNLKIIQPVFFSWGDDDDDTGLMLETNC